MSNSKIPTILAIFVLVIGIASGVFLIQNKKIFKLGASPATIPQDVRITNITHSSFTVSWVTDKESVGSIIWGKDGNLDQKELDQTSKNIHVFSINGLTPQTSYSYKISSNGEVFDNSGISWQTQTGPNIGVPENSLVISGTVLDKNNQPVENVMVYLTGGGISSLSSESSSNGTWLIPTSQARTVDLSSYSRLAETNAALDIFIQGGPKGIATAKITATIGDPIPPIVLGTNMDFRNQTPTETGKLPEASINLPPESTGSSGFHIPSNIPSPFPKTVTLESIKDGELITSTKPEFFGEGPKNIKITITVESETLSDNLSISTLGTWNWSPPKKLDPGEHKITISWRDANGILRKLTRAFIVQAAEVPSFVSTPSASLTPSPTTKQTPTPSPTIKPSVSPTATPIPILLTTTPSLTGSPTVTPTKVPSLPPAGTTLPTIFGAGAGIILLLGAILLAI